MVRQTCPSFLSRVFIGPDARRWARLMALANPIGEREVHFVKGAEQRGILLLSQPDQNT